MKKFCQNPYCESPSFKEVPVSVKKPADQVRALCAPCEESYTWGVQHGRKTAESKNLWILAVADRGIIAHVQAYCTKPDAETGLIKYIRKYHSYNGKGTAQAAYQWLKEHDEYLSVEIFEQAATKASTTVHEPDSPALHVNITGFLQQAGFVVLGRNRQDPHRKADIEAWAYQGPLDFKSAKPVTFGLGKDWKQALQTLDSQLASIPNTSQP